MSNQQFSPEEIASQIRHLIAQLQRAGRNDLLLHAVGVPLLEELRIEAAKGKLSRLVITKDYRFLLEDYHQEVELQPVHKAVYLLFLAHPEGIEFKRLAEYREELTRYYLATAKMMDKFEDQEGVSGADGRIQGELLHHQQSYAEAHRGFEPYLVRAPEGDHAAQGIGNL